VIRYRLLGHAAESEDEALVVAVCAEREGAGTAPWWPRDVALARQGDAWHVSTDIGTRAGERRRRVQSAGGHRPDGGPGVGWVAELVAEGRLLLALRAAHGGDAPGVADAAARWVGLVCAGLRERDGYADLDERRLLGA
jgi:hypothetical protein